MNSPFRLCLLAALLFPAVAGAQHVLEPLDTSSPRSTLAQFLAAVDKVDFSKMQITNLSRRDRMLINTVLGLRYETTPDQLRHLLARLRELLVAHPRVLKDSMRVRFVGLGDFSLNVEIFAYAATTDFPEFLGVQEDILLRVIDLVEASGTGFAFPSQTLYLSRDGGLNAQRKAAAEAEVSVWREPAAALRKEPLEARA